MVRVAVMQIECDGEVGWRETDGEVRMVWSADDYDFGDERWQMYVNMIM
jgi:hypothetical protein